LENGVRIQKTTLLLAGLLAVVVIGTYLVWGAAMGTAQPAEEKPRSPQPSGEVQDVYVRALSSGTYDKEEVSVKKGIPVRFHFTADSGAGCGSYLSIPEFDVKLLSKNGQEDVAEFTPMKEGTYEYSCAMRMFIGRMVVE